MPGQSRTPTTAKETKVEEGSLESWRLHSFWLSSTSSETSCRHRQIALSLLPSIVFSCNHDLAFQNILVPKIARGSEMRIQTKAATRQRSLRRGPCMVKSRRPASRQSSDVDTLLQEQRDLQLDDTRVPCLSLFPPSQDLRLNGLAQRHQIEMRSFMKKSN